MCFTNILFTTTALLFVLPSTMMGQAAHTPRNPCELLKAEAAGHLLGTSVNPGQYRGYSCVFLHDDNHDVTIGLVEAQAKDAAKLFQSAVEMDQERKAEPVTGLGEVAAFLSSPKESDLHVLYHGKIISLGVRGTTVNDLKSAMIRTMKTVLTGI